MAHISLRSIAQALGGEVSGGQVLAPGPGHGEKDRSLSVRLSERPGDIVVHSFAGNDPLECKDYVREKLGLPAWQPQRKRVNGHAPSKGSAPHIVKTYVYKQADSTNYLRVDRTADKKFLQSHWNGAAWVSGKPPGPKIPYRLPDIIDEGTVLICEGEKCADAVAALGFAATTASEGAGKWTAELNEHFKDKTVYVLADNDEVGVNHAEQVAASLQPVADSVRVVLLPNLPVKGDVVDWLNARGTAQQLLDICRETPLWAPKVNTPNEDKPPKNTGTHHGALQIVYASAIEQIPVNWMWPNRIARGKLTLIAGDPNVGKSQIAIDVHARLSTGTVWPDGGQAPLCNSLILSAEDAANDTIVPRLDLAGGDLKRVGIIQAITETNGQKRSFSLQRDLDQLTSAVRQIGNVGLIAIDPITSYMGSKRDKIDSHRTTDVRGVLEPLDRFAQELGIAILAITHPPKAAQSKAIHSFTGSLAFVAAARLAFIAVEEDGTGRTLLLSVKNNLGPKATGIGYRIEGGTSSKGISSSHVVWDGAPVTVNANEAISAAAANRGGTAMRDGKDFLREYLADRPMPAEQTEEAAKANGISLATLRRAREALRIIVRKDGFTGGWTWRLP